MKVGGGGVLDTHLTPVGNLDWSADLCGQYLLVEPSSLVSLSSLAVKNTEWLIWITHGSQYFTVCRRSC